MNLLNDFRYAARTMAKDRAFTIVAVLTLAFALGANTAIFSVVNGILLRPLPYPHAEQLVRVGGINTLTGETFTVGSYDNSVDVRNQAKTFDSLAIVESTASFVWKGDESRRVTGAVVSSDLFRVLRVKPELGRAITAQDDRFGAPSTVVISHNLWKSQFGGDPRIIGRMERFGSAQKMRQIIGVLPPYVQYPFDTEQIDYWMPLHTEAKPDQLVGQRSAFYMYAIARLRDGVTLQAAQSEVDVIAKRLEKQYPNENSGFRFRLEPLQDTLVGPIRPALLLLLAAVALVLLIGCANVANLLLARAAARRREIAIRAAVGATRGRIIGQLLVESVLLSVVAGAIGLLLAAWGVDALKAVAPADIPRVSEISLDPTVLAFTVALSVLTGVLFGLAPALSASKTDLNETLKEGTRGSTEGRGRNRVRNILVTAAISLSLVLLIGTGLLLRSFVRVTQVDPGFEYRDAVVVDLSIRGGITGRPNIALATHHLIDALKAVPGVTGVAATDTLPLTNNQSILTFQFVGRTPFAPGRLPSATTTSITPGYFRTLGIPLRAGRDFTDRDIEGAPNVMVINEEFARQWFAGQNPIGHKIQFEGGTKEWEIVGVAANIHLRDLTSAQPPMFYLPYDQRVGRMNSYVVRTKNASAMIPTVRAALHRADPAQPLLAIRTFDQIRAESLASRRFNLVLLSVLAGLALVLASVGIYSLMSYMVTQRTSEIGIRMALGAATADVFRLIVGNALRLVGIGVAVGVVAALATTRLMSSLLFGVGTTDPSTFIAICALIAGVAMVASWIPARRASRVDPLVAIRYD